MERWQSYLVFHLLLIPVNIFSLGILESHKEKIILDSNKILLLFFKFLFVLADCFSLGTG